MRFIRPATIDSGFWSVPLNKIERLVYFYIASKCQLRWGVPEQEMAMVLGVNVKRIRRAIETLVGARMIDRWKLPRPKCTEYLVLLSTEKGWGIGVKRTHSIGSKRSLLMGPNGPLNGVQTVPPLRTIDNENSCALDRRPGDSALLAIGVKWIRQWKFARRPLGPRHTITGKQTALIVEMMRGVRDLGFDTDDRIETFMRAAGEYLSLDHDRLSDDRRDYRAKTLGVYLANWPDQIHRAYSWMEDARS